MNKRGLSRVVSVVLFILLVILAIVIFWVSLNTNLQEDSQQIESGSQCITLDVIPTRCMINPELDFLTEETCLGDIFPPNDEGTVEFDEFGPYGDGVVGSGDLFALLGSWGEPQYLPADIDNNGDVDPVDMVYLLSSWGDCDSDEGGLTDNDGDNVPIYTCDGDPESDDCNFDGIIDGDVDDDDRFVCGDFDQDGCEDCSSGTFNPTNDGCGDDIIVAEIKRNAGGDDLTKIRFAMEFEDGSVKVIDTETDIQEVETKLIWFDIENELGMSLPRELNIAAVVGKDYVCESKSKPISCVGDSIYYENLPGLFGDDVDTGVDFPPGDTPE